MRLVLVWRPANGGEIHMVGSSAEPTSTGLSLVFFLSFCFRDLREPDVCPTAGQPALFVFSMDAHVGVHASTHR